MHTYKKIFTTEIENKNDRDSDINADHALSLKIYSDENEINELDDELQNV